MPAGAETGDRAASHVGEPPRIVADTDEPHGARPLSDVPRIVADTDEPHGARPLSDVPRIVADVHEPQELIDGLRARGLEVHVERMQPADFLIGPVAIERKSLRDFRQSLFRQRLLEQVTRLREAYPPPVLVLLEGDLRALEGREWAHGFWGAVFAIAVDVGVPIVPTPSLEASADALARLAWRLEREGRRAEVRFKPRMLGPREQQKFALEGLPGVGDVTAKNLLEHFGSVRRVFAASERDLKRVAGIGEKRAAEIAAFLDREYPGAHARLASD